MRARQDRRYARSGGLHDLIRCTRRIPRGGCIFPSAEACAETANRKVEAMQIGEPERDRLARLFGDAIELFGTQWRIFREQANISPAGAVDRARTKMQHAPDTASRRSLDRGGRTSDVDAHDADGIGDLAACTSGDRGKIEDTVRITPAQCNFQAFSIGDVPHDLLKPAGKAGERPLRMFRNRKMIEADDALSAHQ